MVFNSFKACCWVARQSVFEILLNIGVISNFFFFYSSIRLRPFTLNCMCTLLIVSWAWKPARTSYWGSVSSSTRQNSDLPLQGPGDWGGRSGVRTVEQIQGSHFQGMILKGELSVIIGCLFCCQPEVSFSRFLPFGIFFWRHSEVLRPTSLAFSKRGVSWEDAETSSVDKRNM
jgi:hypothetical protein